MLTMYYQTSSAVRRTEENVIDFTAYLPERQRQEPVCRPLTWDAARRPYRRRRKAVTLHRAAELGTTLALLAAALTVPLCLFLL